VLVESGVREVLERKLVVYLGGADRNERTKVCVGTACTLRSWCINTMDQRITTTRTHSMPLVRRQHTPLYHHWPIRVAKPHNLFATPSFAYPGTTLYNIQNSCIFIAFHLSHQRL
jgi:hypothetical protein